MNDVPLLIEFAPGTSVYREQNLVSQLPILRNGPPGTFVVFPTGLRVSLPTDQIISADDAGGRARVGFGGMRSHTMMLEPPWVSSIRVDGHLVWLA